MVCFPLVEFLHRAADLTLVPSVAIGRDLQAARVTAGLLNHSVCSFIFFYFYHLSGGSCFQPIRYAFGTRVLIQKASILASEIRKCVQGWRMRFRFSLHSISLHFNVWLVIAISNFFLTYASTWCLHVVFSVSSSNGEPQKPLILYVGRLGVEKSLDFLKRWAHDVYDFLMLLYKLDGALFSLQQFLPGSSTTRYRFTNYWTQQLSKSLFCKSDQFFFRL